MPATTSCFRTPQGSSGPSRRLSPETAPPRPSRGTAPARANSVLRARQRLLGVPRWGREGSSRVRESPVADPALIRRLDVGQAAYIYRGGVTFVQVKRLIAAPRRAGRRGPVADQSPAQAAVPQAEVSRRAAPPRAAWPGRPGRPPAPARRGGTGGPARHARGGCRGGRALLDEAFGPEPGWAGPAGPWRDACDQAGAPGPGCRDSSGRTGMTHGIPAETGHGAGGLGIMVTWPEVHGRTKEWLQEPALAPLPQCMRSARSKPPTRPPRRRGDGPGVPGQVHRRAGWWPSRP